MSSKFRIFMIALIFVSSSTFLLQLRTLNQNNPVLQNQNNPSKKFAYVFYITEPEYACYAGVNADRLLDDLAIDQSQIDILFLYTSADWRFKQALDSCARPEVKLIKVPDAPMITTRDLYAQSYVRFESFRMTEYERIIILDADGLIIKNMDHLFTIDLDGHPIAGALVDYSQFDWLSSVLLVVEPSISLYNRIRKCLTPDGIHKVSIYANGSHFDMDVLNYAFQSGKDAKLISSRYIALDSSFVDNGRENMDGVHYVHFTARKPLIYVETMRGEDKKNKGDDKKMNKASKWIFGTFWNGFEKRCKTVFENSVKEALEHVDMMEKESKIDQEISRLAAAAGKQAEKDYIQSISNY